MRYYYSSGFAGQFKNFLLGGSRFSYSIVLFIFLLLSSAASSQPGPEWEFSRTINLSGATPLNDYQVKVELNFPAEHLNMKPNGADLRFWAGGAECSYWIEKFNPSGKSVIWVKIPVSGTNTFTMYYGNPAATSMSNGDNTFDFFDDFEGVTLSSKWVNNSPSWSTGGLIVDGSEVEIRNKNSATSMYHKFDTLSLPDSYMVELKHRESLYYRNRYYLSDSMRSEEKSIPNSIPDYGLWSNNSGGATTGYIQWDWNSTGTLHADTSYLMRWDITRSTGKYQWRNFNYRTNVDLYPGASILTFPQISYIHFAVTDYNYISTFIDWVRIRKGNLDLQSTVGIEVPVYPIPVIDSVSSLTGCIGDSFTIYGDFKTNFSRTVKVGSTALGIISQNDSEIVVKYGSVSGLLTVTTNAGTSSGSFQIVVNPKPTVDGGSAIPVICAGGTTVALGGTVTGGTGVWSVDIPGGTFTVPGGNYKLATWTAPAGFTGTATFTLMGTAGSCTAAASKTVSVNQIPTGIVSVSGGPDFCVGEPVTFTAPSGFTSYTFLITRGGSTTSVSNGNNPVYTTSNLLPNDAVKVEVGNNGCVAVLNTQSFAVHAIPSGTFHTSDNSGVAENDSIICQGDPINFYFSNPGFSSYAFIKNGTDTLSKSSLSYLNNVTSLGNNDKISLLVKGGGGCSKLFGPITVKVNPNPTGVLSSNKTDDAICLGDSMSFTASTGFLNYDFLIDDDSKQSSSSNKYSFVKNLADGDMVSVIVKDNNHCYANIDTIQVTVHELPAKPSVSANNPTAFCVGGTRSVTLNINTADPAYTYQWYKNGATYGSITTNSSLGPLSLVSESGNYSVSFVNENGCHSPVSDFVTITIHPAAPKPTVTVSDTEVCEGGSITLTSSTATSYQWYYGGSPITMNPLSGATAQSLTVTQVSQSGYYSVAISNENNCEGEELSDPILITINSLPVTPMISIVSGSLALCEGNVVTFQASSSHTYQWYKNGTAISGPAGTSQNFSTSEAGIYTVITGNANGCLSAISPSQTVIVNPLPEPTIDNGSICIGTSGNVYQTESGKNDYVWTIIGDGTINSGQSTNSITVTWGSSSTPKSLNVKYKDPTTGCESTSQAEFTNLPTLLPIITGPVAVCDQSTVTYQTDPEAKGSDYVWSVSSGGSILTGGSTNSISVKWTGPGSKSVHVNYTLDNCNAPSPTILPVTVSPIPLAQFNYGDTEFCSTVGLTLPTMATGSQKGTFSSDHSGLSLNTSTGAINPSASAPRTYVVTNLIAASNGCDPVEHSTTITITQLPTATVSYSSPFCATDNNLKTPNIIGTMGGVFSAPTGLSIASNGNILPSGSTPGNYAVIYTIPAANGCSAVSIPVSPSVTITPLPVVNLSYASAEICKSVIARQYPIFAESTGAFEGGTFAAAPAGLQIHADSGYIIPSLSQAGVYTITYTAPGTGGCGPVTKDFTLTITEIPFAEINYPGPILCESNTSVVVSFSNVKGAYHGGTFSAPSGLSIAPTTGTINPSLSTPGTYTVQYTIPASGGCSPMTVQTIVSISPKPIVTAGVNSEACTGETLIDVTTGADTAFVGSIMWSGGSGTWTNPTSLTGARYTPAAGETGSILLTLTGTGTQGCSSNTFVSNKTLTINDLPSPVNISPSTSLNLCVGGIQSFASDKNSVSDFVKGPLTSSGGALSIPDNNTNGVSKSITVSGIPSNAIVTAIDVVFNVSHPHNGDLTINLKAANGKVLNLANALHGPGFANTHISSNATNPIQTSGDVGPFTGTYAAQMRFGTQGATSVPGNRAMAKSFDELFSNPNGAWILSARDGGAGDVGSLQNWTITIQYSIPNDPVPVYWTKNGNIPSDLYVDASLSIPYAGEALAVVYASPDSAGTHVYTARSVNPSGCSTTADATIVINPSPKVYIKADYCENSSDGKVTLYAQGVEDAVNYAWSTGQTGASILVDIAHEYYVTVTNSQGCVGTSILSVAEELVVNGDFEQGNVGFYTEYSHMTSPVPPSPFIPDYSGLVMEGTYAVDTSANMYHAQFFGKDHTTSEQKGKFLMVNGKSDLISTGKYPQPHIRIIWEQTVSVLPNTDYYFSAWAMNFSGVTGPNANARLQFEINGVPMGTIADLNLIARPQNPGEVSINNWRRFYNGNTNGVDDTWNSGTNTEAVIRIINLNPAASGNDFGLDDISFGTLAPFVSGPDIAGRDEQIVCVGESIEPIVYKVGSGDEPVDGLPSMFTSNFDGYNYTIQGQNLMVPGVYEYVLTTTGNCPIPATATGKITVVENPEIVLSTANKDATICLNDNLASSILFNISDTVDNAVFSGLPSGITGVYNPNTKIASISGASTQSGTFNYTLKTEGMCKTDSISGVITVDAPPVPGSLSSNLLCLNDDGQVTLSGHVGDIIAWYVSDDGVNYTSINNHTNTQPFTNITNNKYFKVEVGNGVCSTVSTEPITLAIRNLWEGKLGTDWNNPLNWASKNVPTNLTSVCGGVVTIPQVLTGNHRPVLTGVADITHLNLLSGADFTINTGGRLVLRGNITNAGTIHAINGSVEYAGNTARTIQSGIFENNNLGGLIINNNNTGGVILNTPLNIFDSVAFGTVGKKLITNGHLTLKSSQTKTASVGRILSGKTISGEVTVERFINTGAKPAGGHPKSWQLLATPTVGQTIQESWQEGAVSDGYTPIKYSITGYGTMLTTGYKDVPQNGFDLYTAPGPSIKTWDPLLNNYDKGPSSTSLPIYNERGYMVLVRGDRTVYTASEPATPTILRTKGNLIIGNKSISVPANRHASIGNPYASAISIKDIVLSGGIDEFIYVWDPLLGGSYGLGGFVTLSKNGEFYVGSPSTGSYPGPVTQIQSGQAFFVQTGGTSGTVTFSENAKVSGSQLVMRTGKGDRISRLRSNLYGINTDGSVFITDGTLQEFEEEYSNEINGFDARKMSNSSENMSIKVQGKLLAIERRKPAIESDTIFFNLSGLRAQKYMLSFSAKDFGKNVHAYLEDTYLSKKSLVAPNGETNYEFVVTSAAGSYAANRFRIVFKSAHAPLPVTFISVKGTVNTDNVMIDWVVNNESQIVRYELERSKDGINFSPAGYLKADQSSNYQLTDKNNQPGTWHYRLVAVSQTGKKEMSPVAKVAIQGEPSRISVFPNPIVNGIVKIHLINQPIGKYKINLINPAGQSIYTTTVNHLQSTTVYPIEWDYKMARGVYQIEVIKPDNSINLIKVMY